jgi:hypothetical protein
MPSDQAHSTAHSPGGRFFSRIATGVRTNGVDIVSARHAE